MAYNHTAFFQGHGQHPSSSFVGKIDNGTGMNSLDSVWGDDSSGSYGPVQLNGFVL